MTKTDLNSALFWFPRIQAAGLPVPQTKFVPYDHHGAIASMEGMEIPKPPVDFDAITKAANEIGFPVFIRQDHTSAKHRGPRCYKWNGVDEDDLKTLIWHLVEDVEMKLWMGADLSNSAFMVREFLDLEAPFEAFGQVPGMEGRVGLPIAREWRFFADQDGIICAHPYWTPDAFDDEHHPWGLERTGNMTENDLFEIRAVEGPPGWREALADLEQPIKNSLEAADLHRMALEAAKACPQGGAWSVDFAKTRNGKWFLIDMALAKDSHHRASCKNSKNYGGKE